MHEVNRRLRRWGITPPPLASVAAHKERQGRRAANQQRLAITVRHYIRGASIEEAAIAGQTSTHYLYRIARTVFESFGETLRNLRGFPTYIRYALAEDAQHTLQGGTSYAAPLLALYRKTPQTRPRRYAATLKDGFVDLLPGAIASQFTIDEIAEAKETPATVITQRFTDLLLPIGLTWHAIEQMSDYHRDAFYQLLLMKPPERALNEPHLLP